MFNDASIGSDHIQFIQIFIVCFRCRGRWCKFNFVFSFKTVYNKLALVYGVEPVLVDDDTFEYSNKMDIVENLKANQIVEAGQKVLIIAGLDEHIIGRQTDSLLLVDII